MNDGIRLVGKLEYVAKNKDGEIIGTGFYYNAIQEDLLEGLIDGLDTGTMSDIDCMAIGTGTGQGLADTTLSSYASYESNASSFGKSQTSATVLSSQATFTATAAWTITEAGLFTDGTGAAGMFTYNDGLSQALTSGDTLQITWTVTAA